MPEYIRVTDEVEPRREYSVVASAVDPDVHTVLDKPGAGADGTPIPPKYTPESLSSNKVGAAPAPATSGRKATPEKEAD